MEAKIAEVTEIAEELPETEAWIASTNMDKNKSSIWILDSGATTHITPNRQNFVVYNEFPSPKTIGTADHGSFKAHGIGKIKIKIKDLVNTNIELMNVLYAPGCTTNLLSVNALTLQGNSVNFIGNKCTIFDKSG